MLEQVVFQKHFLKYPSWQSRIAAKHTSDSRNSRGLTGNVGHSRAARCLRIVKFFFLHVRHSPCFAESGSDHKIHLCSTVELFPSLHDKFSVTPQLPCDLVRDSLNKVHFSSLIIRRFCGFPSELDKPIGLHDVTLIFVIQKLTVDSIHNHPIRISLIPNPPSLSISASDSVL